MQFLMGYSFKPVRGQLLLMKPFPSVEDAYSMIQQEERQMDMSHFVYNDANSTALMSGKKQAIYRKNASSYMDSQQIISLKERQVTLVSFGGHMVQQVTANNLNSTSHAGISYCLSVKHASNTWILDSGATDHITKSMSLLESPKLLTTPKSVHLPDGSIASVTHIGHVTLTSTIVLQNVLFVPSFHHNLLFISKLSCDSHCSINFTPTSCIMQGPMLKNPVVLSKQIDGLYCFDSSHDHFHSALSTSLNNIELWHHRLGHTVYTKKIK
ncbi:hypothetical protein BUALT_Bualt14G0107800 [Buddleja alternifolia]|uniref:Retrovirus-related Pol polyprotein from transposon TNT 1-94-like beta-barrel domain-containing protein n=1 Tax=Buddleja alternifolia TaxID=168488 RepID=A0AAV6WTN8_9LAMI|nr:hypothetical protein BUALT_Bualt14G0107800 [Buddleja alternifolia]